MYGKIAPPHASHSFVRPGVAMAKRSNSNTCAPVLTYPHWVQRVPLLSILKKHCLPAGRWSWMAASKSIALATRATCAVRQKTEHCLGPTWQQEAEPYFRQKHNHHTLSSLLILAICCLTVHALNSTTRPLPVAVIVTWCFCPLTLFNHVKLHYWIALTCMQILSGQYFFYVGHSINQLKEAFAIWI